MVGSSGTETGFLMAGLQPIATPLQQNGWFQWNWEWGKGGEAQQASQVEMKLDYLRLCSRASDNPGFIWFCEEEEEERQEPRPPQNSRGGSLRGVPRALFSIINSARGII